MLRDVLVNQVPVVLRADLYALAALAGAAVVVSGHLLAFPPVATAIVGGVPCVALRYMAIEHGWHLPAVRRLSRSHEKFCRGAEPVRALGGDTSQQ